MSKTNGDNWYIDFMNPSYALDKYLHSNDKQPFNFRNMSNIVNTCITMFRYPFDKENFPYLTSTVLETALMFSSKLCFYHLPSLGGWFLLRYLYDNELNNYNLPTTVSLVTLNGITVATNVPYEDIVIVKDNDMDIPRIVPLLEYMQRIDYIEQVNDKVLHNATLPLVLVGNKKQANQLKSLANNIGINSPFVVGDDTVLDQIKSFDISVPINPLDIYDLRRKYTNECMSSIGIYSVEEKRERIVTQELVNQNDYTDFVYMSRLLPRQFAMKELSKRIGKDYKVIETYDLNFRDSVNEEKYKQFNIEKAKAKGEFEGNPKAFEKQKEGDTDE